MFTYFPFRCCKDHVCDCCLSEKEQTDKLINIQLKRIRLQSFYEGKVILLGKDDLILNIGWSIFCLGNAEAGK